MAYRVTLLSKSGPSLMKSGVALLMATLTIGVLHSFTVALHQEVASLHLATAVIFAYFLKQMTLDGPLPYGFRVGNWGLLAFFVQLFLERGIPAWPQLLDAQVLDPLYVTLGSPARYSPETAVGQLVLLLSLMCSARRPTVAIWLLLLLIVMITLFAPLKALNVVRLSQSFSIFSTIAFVLCCLIQVVRLKDHSPLRPFLSLSRLGLLARTVLMAGLVAPWIFGLLLSLALQNPNPLEQAVLVLAISGSATALLVTHARMIETFWYELEHAATHDLLTGLMNRRGIAFLLDEHSPKTRPYGVILLDIDHFKGINDTFGHMEGDRVLSEVGARIAEVAAQSQATAARWGGEEFIMLLPGSNLAELIELAETTRRAMDGIPLGLHPDAPDTVRLSCGLSRTDRSEASLDPAIARADAALYNAKRFGRDRLCVHVPDTSLPVVQTGPKPKATDAVFAPTELDLSKAAANKSRV